MDETWLEGFAAGLFELADATGISLVGGDVTRGPLSVSIQATGAVPVGQALRRSGARVGDAICVGGVTGAGLLGLQQWQQGQREGAAVAHFRRPVPQLALGQALRGTATACIDISDGTVADLGHILAASGGLGAVLDEALLPVGTALLGDCDVQTQRQLQLQGGDDDVVLVTLDSRTRLPEGCHRLGTVESQPGVRLNNLQGQPVPLTLGGWQHF